MTTFDHGELLETLRQAMQGVEEEGLGEGFTTSELSQMTGWSVDKCRKAVHAAAKAGVLKGTQVRRTNIQGFVQKVAGYTLLDV